MSPRFLQRFVWPACAALAALGLSLWALFTWDVNNLPATVPAGSMTFGIVVSGFVATQRNMLLTMTGAEVLLFAVRTGLYKDVIGYLMDCIRVSLLLVALSCAGLFISTYKPDPPWAEVWLCIMASHISLIAWLIIRNEKLVARIVMRYLEEQKSEELEQHVDWR